MILVLLAGAALLAAVVAFVARQSRADAGAAAVFAAWVTALSWGAHDRRPVHRAARR